MTAPAIPAAAPRPRIGAMANAIDPAMSAFRATPTANANAASTAMLSPSNLAKFAPVSHVSTPTMVIAMATATT